MKKLQLFALFFAATLISSCSKEETNPEVTVSSTLATPADLLLASTTLSGAN